MPAPAHTVSRRSLLSGTATALAADSDLQHVARDRALAQWWKTGTARSRSTTETPSAELVCACRAAHLAPVPPAAL